MTNASSRQMSNKGRGLESPRFGLTGLGNVVVTRDSDATRVQVSSKKIRTLLSNFLDVNSKGILLEQDVSGWLMHRGWLTYNQVSLRKGGFGSKPIIFAVDRSIRPRSTTSKT